MVFSTSKKSDFEPLGPDHGASGSFSFSNSLTFLRSKAHMGAEKNKMSLSNIKLQFELSFQDIEGASADRLRHKIRAAREVKELWMLRSELHLLISRKASQFVAAQTINALLPCFAHSLPEKMLVKI